jgi:chemotaxis protein MotB
MSSRTHRKPHGHASAEHHVDERWMASYMDMVTVLMCMFLVLFAMSSVDAGKFQKLKDSLASGFGVVTSQKVDPGTLDNPATAKPGEPTLAVQALAELNRLEKLKKAINAAEAKIGLQNDVTYDIDARGLTVHLASSTYFASNSTQLTDVATRVLTAASGPLRGVSNGISIEGHADKTPAHSPFPTNWELSADRAVAVLRELVEQGHIASQRVGATGYGDARPAASGGAADALAKNRRVDVVVLSNAPEDVRALIPALLKAEGAQ